MTEQPMKQIKFKAALGPYRAGEVREFPADRCAIFVRDGQARYLTPEERQAGKTKTPPPAPEKDQKDQSGQKAPGGPPVDKMERGPGDGRTVVK